MPLVVQVLPLPLRTLPTLDRHLHSAGGACRGSGLGGAAVSVAVAEAAPLQT